jgi:ABC-2 type transport system ATP-binding protein
MAGLINITDGAAQVAGYDIAQHAEAVKPRIGYMAQRFSLYGELSVSENLDFFSELYDVNTKELAERKAQLLTFAGLTEFEDRRAKHLSGGMKKKLALACTLIHQPEILLLDEPTTGVDPVSRREFWDILINLYLGGTTIVVSTPYMDEADRCSRVGLMYAGKLVLCAAPREIRQHVQGDLVEIRPDDWQATYAVLVDHPSVLELQTYGDMLHVLVESAEHALPRIKATLNEYDLTYRSLRRTTPRMEEAFISLIRHLEET